MIPTFDPLKEEKQILRNRKNRMEALRQYICRPDRDRIAGDFQKVGESLSGTIKRGLLETDQDDF